MPEMVPNHYPTSTEVKCFIGSYHIDDVHRLEYREQNPKVPLYGYNQKYLVDVADGQSIIVGNLTILYRYPGYLLSAIGNVVRDPDVQPPDHKERNRVKEAIRFLRSGSPEDRVKYLANASPEQFQLYSELLEATFNGTPTLVAGSPVDLSPQQTPGGFDMTVVYYNGAAPYFAEVIKGVHMTGRHKVISIAVGQSDLGGAGQPLYETYSFLAKRAEEIRTDRIFKQFNKLSEIMAKLQDPSSFF